MGHQSSIESGERLKVEEKNPITKGYRPRDCGHDESRLGIYE